MLRVYYGGTEYSVRVSALTNASVYFDLMGAQSLLLPVMSLQTSDLVLLTPCIDKGLLRSLQHAEVIGAWRRTKSAVEAEFGPALLEVIESPEVA